MKLLLNYLLCFAVLLGGCELPPTPTPDPTPNPIPISVSTGVRVIILFESAQNHTQEELNILNSTAIQALLSEECEEWRKWDKSSIETTGVSDESKSLQAIWQATKGKVTKLPCLVVARQTNAEVLQMPPTEAEVLALLKAKVN